MSSDVPYLTYMALYVLSFHILQINSRTSTFWKLNAEEGKIVVGSRAVKKDLIIDDPVFDIITTTVHHGGKSWTKQISAANCHLIKLSDNGQRSTNDSTPSSTADKSTPKTTDLPRVDRDAGIIDFDHMPSSTAAATEEDDDVLDCGKSVNFTYYDNLVGVNNRHNHPLVPEPQVSLIFHNNFNSNNNNKKGGQKNAGRAQQIDVNALERKLKKAKREKPKSVQLYNQIGNFWRIKGDAYKSIECFRRALAVSPHNAEVLLNLARVLLNLQYLDDAIYLTRRSLELQPPDRNAWQQYFTLGEIFKAYGHYQEASAHMRHSLELRPEFEPALAALRAMDAVPETAVQCSTLCIIAALSGLVMSALAIMIRRQQKKRRQADSSSALADGNNGFLFNSAICEPKSTSSLSSSPLLLTSSSSQKHFNRAMAMRSLKMGISSRALRGKR